MTTFTDSTQQRYWMFSRAELEHLRREANGESFTTEKFLERVAIPAELQIRRICDSVQSRHEGWDASLVANSAIPLLKRYLLRRSCDTVPIQNVILTAIYTAAKAEEYRMDASQIINAAHAVMDGSVAARHVLEFELEFLSALSFRIVVHTPHACARGYLYLYQQVKEGELKQEFGTLKKKSAKRVQQKRTKEIRAELQSLSTTSAAMLDTLAHCDSIFLYTPSQQAIAVMYSLAKERDCTKLLEMLQQIWAKQGETSVSTLESIVEEIQELQRDVEKLCSRAQQ